MKNILIAILLLTCSAFAQYGGDKSNTKPAGGGATIVCVQGGPGCTNSTSTSNGASNATALPLTLLAAATAGHAVVVVSSTFHQPTSVTSAHDTLTQGISVQYLATGQYVNIYYICSSAGSDTVYTINLPAGSYGSAQVLELSGVQSSSCADGSGVSATGTGTTNPSSGPLTPAGPKEVFFGASWNSSAAGTLNWTSANDLFDLNTNNVGNGAFIISTTASAQTAAWTLGATNWVAAIFALKHA